MGKYRQISTEYLSMIGVKNSFIHRSILGRSVMGLHIELVPLMFMKVKILISIWVIFKYVYISGSL